MSLNQSRQLWYASPAHFGRPGGLGPSQSRFLREFTVGSQPRPGEISLAQHGVLYLDELGEFSRATLEVLRQPLEEGTVTIARAAATLTFPARFTLVASMNPCPCGFRGVRGSDCRCDDAAVQKYLAKLSGPLLDRIDF